MSDFEKIFSLAIIAVAVMVLAVIFRSLLWSAVVSIPKGIWWLITAPWKTLVRWKVPQERIVLFRNEIAWWAKPITLFPDLFRWSPVILILSTFVILGLALPQAHAYLVMLCGPILLIPYLKVAVKPIPSQNEDGQPTVGLFVVGGVRIPRTFKSGLALIIPVVSDVILVPRNQINKDITFTGVRCRLESSIPVGTPFIKGITQALADSLSPTPDIGGEVDASVSFTFEPKHEDGWALLEMDNTGGIEEAQSILIDMIGEDVRQTGSLLTWSEAAFATDALSARLIADATGAYELKKNGRTINVLGEMTREEIRTYLEEARRNGFADTKGLGFRIKRVNVTNIRPIGELARAAESAAVELLRTKGLVRNAKGLQEAALEMQALLNDGSLSMKYILETVMVAGDPDARVKRDIKDININMEGLPSLSPELIKLLQQLAAKFGANPN